jgi:hypothetical protein
MMLMAAALTAERVHTVGASTMGLALERADGDRHEHGKRQAEPLHGFQGAAYPR